MKKTLRKEYKYKIILYNGKQLTQEKNGESRTQEYDNPLALKQDYTNVVNINTSQKQLKKKE